MTPQQYETIIDQLIRLLKFSAPHLPQEKKDLVNPVIEMWEHPRTKQNIEKFRLN